MLMKPARKRKNPLAFIKDGNLRRLHGAKKIQYIWDYYKLPLFLLGVCLYVLFYNIYGRLTYKEPVLYAALININAGDDLIKGLDADFLNYLELDRSKNKLELYTGLYLTDDETNVYHQYAYASRIKLLAAIDGELLDVVLMNKEAFDAFSQNGYLCDLEELLSQENPLLYDKLKSDCVTNLVILEDNAVEAQLDPSVSYYAVTKEHLLGVELSRAELFRQAGFEESVYLGIIANSPRKAAAISYLKYLFS